MRNILFIHPDHKVIGIYHRHLSPYFHIDSAHDGLAGLRLIRHGNPNIIISEYNLPYMSGLALLQFVRQHPEKYNIPFMFLSQGSMPDEALGLGATAWLKQNENDPTVLLKLISQHV
jgi:CheY-like chemotaxis protein